MFSQIIPAVKEAYPVLTLERDFFFPRITNMNSLESWIIFWICVIKLRDFP